MAGNICQTANFGNTFYLRYQMHASGADPIIKRKVAEGVLYVGASASSICAGQTASIGFWKGWDDPGFGESWQGIVENKHSTDVEPTNQVCASV